MALNKTTLAAKIKEAFDKQSDKGISDEKKNKDMEKARKEMADEIAEAIHTYITNGDVKTTVTGTCIYSGAIFTGTTSTGKIT